MITLKGFDSVKIGEYIELPNIGELLHIPNFVRGDYERCLKHNNPYVREILQKVPLVNDRKYITVRIELQYLTPNCITVPRASWHYDTEQFDLDQVCRTHLLISDCSSMTEFSKLPIQLDQFNVVEDHIEIEKYMNLNADELFKETITIPNNCYITWEGLQPHRCKNPKQREFRFMIRVIESNFLQPKELYISPASSVFVDNHDLKSISGDYVHNKEMDIRVNVEKIYKPNTHEAQKIVIHIT